MHHDDFGPSEMGHPRKSEMMNIDEIRKHAFLVPILTVADLLASLRFYLEVLWFERSWEWGDPPNYACVAFGDAELFLCQGGQGQAGTRQNWPYFMGHSPRKLRVLKSVIKRSTLLQVWKYRR
jgi:hypothetical protein